MTKSLSPELIAQLLNEEKTPQVRATRNHFATVNGIRPITPSRGPWRLTESARKCASKRCGVETWMTFDGVPYCTVHGLQVLNDMCIKLTDRVENSLKGRTTVVGDLLGSYDEADSD